MPDTKGAVDIKMQAPLVSLQPSARLPQSPVCTHKTLYMLFFSRYDGSRYQTHAQRTTISSRSTQATDTFYEDEESATHR